MPYQSPGHASDEDLTHRTGSAQGRSFDDSERANRQPAICPTDDDAIVPNKKAVNKQSWEYVVKSGVAGGVAACAAKTIVGPLDRVKILFQASSPQFAKYTGSWFGVLKAMGDIYKENGTRGLFRGHSATLLRIFPYAGIKFLAYEQIRYVIIPTQAQETHVRRFMSGSLAGCLSVFCTYPLEVIRVRLAFETKSSRRIGLAEICSQIYNERLPTYVSTSSTFNSIKNGLGNGAVGAVSASEAGSVAQATTKVVEKAAERIIPQRGIANFFRGFTPTLWGMIPYAGFSFLTHDYVGDLLRHQSIAKHTTIEGTAGGANKDPTKPPQLKSWAELIAGGTAGFVSQTASYPLEVIRRRMQVGGAVGDGHRLRMAEVARNIWVQSGWKGFFIGLGIGYFKVVPMAATSFYVYERSKFWLGI